MENVYFCDVEGGIGGHLVKELIDYGYGVRNVDVKMHEYVEW